MKEIRKRPETEVSDEMVGKRPRTPSLSEAEDEYEEELLLAGLLVDEATLMEVMKVLEKEISCPANANNSNPSSSVMYSPSSSFVTINGNEESCGPSFSDSASTLMANVDMGGISISYFMGPVNEMPIPSSGSMDFSATTEEQWLTEIGESSVSSISGEGINNGFECEVEESDDEWLDRVLNEAPFEFEM
ncbi:hypothetical protein NE237_026801 [Protea cynaroides]|uniref:Uncharacterized protein n=1 Tax=Protea cynaroides TaxID=273540 RepID=A0A9Q0JRC1_9MAGN|nr:hypothetical protein NE237_026801 [Protea cynaroides]